MTSIGEPTFISEFTVVVDRFRAEGTQDAYAALIAMAAAHMEEPGLALRQACNDIFTTLDTHGSIRRMADQIFDDIQRVIRGEAISMINTEGE
jgi:hypothetical protein